VKGAFFSEQQHDESQSHWLNFTLYVKCFKVAAQLNIKFYLQFSVHI